MEQFHLLILLSVGMLIGSFLSGTVPMAFKLSDNKSRLLALMGSGILVGTALAIIIPEGINSIYAQPDLPIESSDSAPYKDAKGQLLAKLPQEPVETWVIGISLVAGFVLMLLIDQFSIYQSGEYCGDDDDNLNHLESLGHRHSRHADYTLANQDDDDDEELSHGAAKAAAAAAAAAAGEHAFETISEARPIRDPGSHRISIRSANQSPDGRQLMSKAAGTKVTPTLGLVIHAAADGVALGAAATTSHREVEMIIFLAIMLHKAPAAFSLVVFLLHRGLKHSTIRRHLMAFSLSAPLAALLTYFGLSQSGKEALRRNNATGIAMLFSAGTFLYVATVHVLPELVHNKLLTPRELIFLVGGAFLPILLAESI